MELIRDFIPQELHYGHWVVVLVNGDVITVILVVQVAVLVVAPHPLHFVLGERVHPDKVIVAALV
jgi:hypothetical protein